jgi:hypothetical protein
VVSAAPKPIYSPRLNLGLIAPSAPLLRQRTYAIKQDPGCPAIILVIIENTLAHCRITGCHPAIKPLDRCRARRMRIAPLKAEMPGQRLDREIPPLGFLLELNFALAKAEADGEIIQTAGLPTFINDKSAYVTEDCISVS